MRAFSLGEQQHRSTYFKLKWTTKMGKVMRAFRSCVNEGTKTFFYNGKPVHENDTPSSLCMKSEDRMEACCAAGRVNTLSFCVECVLTLNDNRCHCLNTCPHFQPMDYDDMHSPQVSLGKSWSRRELKKTDVIDLAQRYYDS